VTTLASAVDLSSQPPHKSNRVMRTETQWKALLDEFNTSGLTRSAFCKQHRIATSSLYRWQKVLTEPSAADKFVDITESVAKAAPALPVPDNNSHWQVELELGAGVTRICVAPSPGWPPWQKTW